MFSYDQFRSFINSGISYQNRFYINIGLPTVMLDHPVDTVGFFCKNVSVPGVNVSSTPVKITGEMIEVPYDRTFGNITVTFFTDINLNVREYFEQWIRGIQNTDTRVMGFYRDYITDIDIFVLDKVDEKRYQMTCFECYPKTVAALSLDNEQPGMMMFDVTFEFRYYKTSVINAEGYRFVGLQQSAMNKKLGGLGANNSILPESYKEHLLNDPANVAKYSNDPAAMNIIANDPVAMSKIVDNPAARESLWESDIALEAIGESPVGWQALRDAPGHFITTAPNLIMDVANQAFDTYSGVKYITTGVGLDIAEAQSTLLALKDLRDGSIRPSTLGAATQGVTNTTSALGKIVSPMTGPVSITPTGESVTGSLASIGLLKV